MIMRLEIGNCEWLLYRDADESDALREMIGAR